MGRGKSSVNSPTGIEIRNDSIRVRFTYRGERCAETLKGKAATKSNIAFAEKKLAVINYEIAEGVFDYTKHFPSSKKTHLYGGIDRSRTVLEGLESWLARKKAVVAPSSYLGYKNKAYKHLVPKFGTSLIKSIKKTDIEYWQVVELPAQELSNKTINLIFIALRGIFKDAMGDQIIDFNPVDLINNLEIADNLEPDPFSNAELDKLLSIDTHRQQELNAYGFNSWVGLRESELLALAWEDIDLDKWTVKISRGLVINEYKMPKTRSSTREFDLQDDAIYWLKRQREYTEMLPAAKVKTRQQDGRTFKTESLRFVFHNTNTKKPWSGDTVFRKVFTSILRKAKVRYRGPNQLRHTFASRLLTQYIPPEWIAPIMGTSMEMLRKHYGKFIPSDRPNLGRIISDMLKSNAEKCTKYVPFENQEDLTN